MLHSVRDRLGADDGCPKTKRLGTHFDTSSAEQLKLCPPDVFLFPLPEHENGTQD